MTKLLKLTSLFALLGVICIGIMTACKKKNAAPEKPQFVATNLPPTTGDVVLAEVNSPYPLTFDYKGGKSVTITIQGMDPITENLTKTSGTFSKNITFTLTGTFDVTIALTGTNGEVLTSTGGKFQVGQAGMNWIPNGDLIPNAEWTTFTSWTLSPNAASGQGWSIEWGGDGFNPDVTNPEYINFWSGTGDEGAEPATNYTANIWQDITLPNGTYTLSIRYGAGRRDTYGSYDPTTVQLKAQGIGATDIVKNLLPTEFNAGGKNVWATISEEITITTRKCKVGVYVDASTAKGLGNAVDIDYFKLVRK